MQGGEDGAPIDETARVAPLYEVSLLRILPGLRRLRPIALSGSEVEQLTPALDGATASAAHEGRFTAVATMP